jgi:hypothetical protein
LTVKDINTSYFNVLVPEKDMPYPEPDRANFVA